MLRNADKQKECSSCIKKDQNMGEVLNEIAKF